MHRRHRTQIGRPAALPLPAGAPVRSVLPAPAPGVVGDEIARLEARKFAVAADVVHLGQNETFELFGELQNLNSALAGISVPVSIVEFTVPEGQVLRIDAISVESSHPVFFTTRSIGWRLAVSSGRLPNMLSPGSDMFNVAVGNVGGPMSIATVWVQSGSVVQVQGVARGALGAMDSSNTLYARLAGRIFRPASSKVMDSGVGL